MTLEQLKAHAYDCLVNIETWQKELQATNAEIAKAQNGQPEEAVIEPAEAKQDETAE